MYCCLRLFFPTCRTFYFTPLSFLWFSSTHFSILRKSLWMEAKPPGVSATPPSSFPSTHLLRLCFTPSSRSLMKMLNSTRLNIVCLSKLLTGLLLYFVQLIASFWAWPFNQFSGKNRMTRRLQLTLLFQCI